MRLASQLALMVIGVALLALWPPAHGRLLLVPLRSTTQGALLSRVLPVGGRLVGQGPGGSLVIEGDRAKVAAVLAGRFVLLIAAPHGACGDRA